MQTSLYKLTFKNGRTFNVFCANKKQNRDMLGMIERLQSQKVFKRNGQEVIAVGITTMTEFLKWEHIITSELMK